MNSTSDGPGSGLQRPLGPIGATLESMRQTLVLLWLRRTVLWFAVVVALFAIAGLAIARSAPARLDGSLLYGVLAWWGFGMVVVPWATIYLGVQVVHGELEARVSQYLFLRPVARVWILAGKWLAVAGLATAFVCLGLLLMFLAVASNDARWPVGVEWAMASAFCQAFGLGVLAYSAVAVLFASTFRRPLAWAAFFVVGVQLVAANLPVSAGLRGLTITDPVRRVLLDRIEPGRELTRALWPAERAVSDAYIGAPEQNLLWLTCVCLALAIWRYGRSEYETRGRD